jgi:hypothetical protein
VGGCLTDWDDVVDLFIDSVKVVETEESCRMWGKNFLEGLGKPVTHYYLYLPSPNANKT